MNVGELDKLITITQIVKGKDADGFPVDVRKVIASDVWARVKTTRGYTLIKNGTDFEKAYTNFMIRYISGIETGMTVTFNSQDYKIVYANNINEENEWLELQAEKVTKNG